LIIPFSEIASTQKGKNPSVKSKKKLDGYIPYIDIKAFEQGIFETYTNGKGCLFCNDGDVLIVWDGARAGLTGIAYKGAVGSTLVKIDIPFVEKKYILFFLQYNYRELNAKPKGTGIPHINPNVFDSLPFPLPPLPEQQRIVAKIDTLFSELDNSVALLKNIKTQMVVYRQAVLKWAFEGKLIETPLVGFPLQNITLFFDISGGLTKNSKRDKLKRKMPYLRVANVYFNFIDLSEIKIIGVLESEIEKTLLSQDDLLFVEGNGSKEQIGRVAFWNSEIDMCLHQNHIIKGRPNGEMTTKYAVYYFMSKLGRDQILNAAASTSGLYTLSVNKIKSFMIPYCPKPEQLAIVSAIESRLSVCDKLEQTIDQTLALSASLRQSILKKAFEGRLVPQDPNDEPAEKLLERIKTEKAAVLAKQKRGRK
jgi:type I restriction enzyme S subunit